MPLHQVKAGIKVTALRGKLVEQPSRAQFVQNNQSSSFKVKSKLHTVDNVHLVCRPGNQWRTPCLTASPLVLHVR